MATAHAKRFTEFGPHSTRFREWVWNLGLTNPFGIGDPEEAPRTVPAPYLPYTSPQIEYPDGTHELLRNLNNE